MSNDQNKLITTYYELENAALVSPHGLRKRMDKGDDSFLLVDVRSAEEYANCHIKGAINIPVYSDPDTAVYHETDRMLSAFQALPTNKELIIYCYSKMCMSGKKVGKLLTKNGIFPKHLGIGWNEWRHSWKSWNHEHEWETALVENYIEGAKNPSENNINCVNC